ncbi:imidazole glycerol phosphate synthase subunit HisH [Alicyclobacillus sp. TC]|uniref:imidazole glycerol phosphate synthase subunit HisH n=1 Tax=Alicyclobacillus sp. TC TaxID=2606450 RepID=UPI001EE4097A|nr:imidazole glycerol phosphate synthase subunit HisH [Alicyclobacillus sp. TC]
MANLHDWQMNFDPSSQVKALVLPGVGAFGDAMFQLRSRQLLSPLKKLAASGFPILGICLGMQLLFSTSEEHQGAIGLGLLPGKIVRFPSVDRVPHMGWNTLDVLRKHPLLNGIDPGDFVYFVHSYYAVPLEEEIVFAATHYADVQVPAIVGRGQLFGMQFHPEKSGRVGAKLLENFVELSEQGVRPNVRV